MKLSVLMPVFNEALTIAAVVERVRAVPLDHEVVLVNDARLKDMETCYKISLNYGREH